MLEAELPQATRHMGNPWKLLALLTSVETFFNTDNSGRNIEEWRVEGGKGRRAATSLDGGGGRKWQDSGGMLLSSTMLSKEGSNQEKDPCDSTLPNPPKATLEPHQQPQ